jgi:acetate kinase
MKVLVLNSGSSSLKFELFEIAGRQERKLARGEAARIGSTEATFSFQGERATRAILNHKEAITAAFESLSSVARAAEIDGVGHRIVHGGEDFRESAILDNQVAKRIESLSELAPLHNPHNLKGYYESRALLPRAIHVAVFDTAFHQTLAPRAFVYGIPYEHYARSKVRRYGFHGTSHRYLALRFAELSGSDRRKLITCHLGNGCSVCAIDGGKSVDTSMGFTPIEGLLMGTRTGDLDPGAVSYLAARGENLEEMLNQRSGLLGVSGISNDMRDLLNDGSERACLAVDIFCYRVKKYVGAYLAAMNGADALVFSGGIGENSPPIRARICESLDSLGVCIDPARNDSAKGIETEIGDGAVKVWVIPTDEELLIARDTARMMEGTFKL